MSRSPELYQEIIRVLEEDKPYTDPDFSSQILAEMVGTNRTSLWKILRDRDLSFTSLVNSYRTSEAIDIVMNPKNSNLTVEEVAILTGFGSVRTMNRYLRRSTGFSAYELRERMSRRK